MAEKEELGLGLKEEIIQAVLKRINFDRLKNQTRQLEITVSALRQNLYELEKRLNRFDDKKERQIIEMFKEIKEEIMKPKSEYQSLNQLFTFLIHSLAGKPTMQDLNIADPTIEQVKKWSDKLIEADEGLVKGSPDKANKILDELLKDMQKYLKEMKT